MMLADHAAAFIARHLRITLLVFIPRKEQRQWRRFLTLTLQHAFMFTVQWLLLLLLTLLRELRFSHRAPHASHFHVHVMAIVIVWRCAAQCSGFVLAHRQLRRGLLLTPLLLTLAWRIVFVIPLIHEPLGLAF